MRNRNFVGIFLNVYKTDEILLSACKKRAQHELKLIDQSSNEYFKYIEYHSLLVRNKIQQMINACTKCYLQELTALRVLQYEEMQGNI